MTTFLTLSRPMQGVVGTWFYLLALVFCYNLIRFVQQKRPLRYICLAAALIAANCALFKRLILLMEREGEHAVAPLWLLLALLPFMTLCAIVQQQRITVWGRAHITTDSVREGFDTLPAGLCYAWPEGLPKLVNAAMDALCRRVTGAALKDARAFWKALTGGAKLPGVEFAQRGEHPILRLADGTACSFQRNIIALEGQPLYEIIATDVTEEYRLSLELAEKQQRADAINRRLRALSGTIAAMTIERETLEARIRVHDGLGQALLRTRQYLDHPESTDAEELLRLWNDSIALLETARPDPSGDAWSASLPLAASLGIDVRIEGELPDDPALARIADAALSTHITNAVQHADATQVRVDITREGDMCVLSFTNNGRPPAGPIVESGGLANLRVQIEAAGGVLQITSAPVFRAQCLLHIAEAQKS